MYVISNLINTITAAQMWLLGRVLPLIIGDYIPDDDEHWANFLKLLDITDFLFSPDITSEHVSYLRTLIYEHHEDYDYNDVHGYNIL